ncbi:EF-hand calcium-binding domain-containing protein 6-like isoform X2 [Mizuhopecten yessoensis]|uniref:EF-hand calcium-binding domain-containing protein 6 n=1 Tax=Mizuhopecten yessoensis TaxID=6573 RepID=A0A210Q0Y4_MIZYE|nr:EF-hand calcium-binding domain-containing protein 6-like isoform X2 [Mizuhopecten yessoensis]OWF42398.1 EF-hand calcium-binding domain-containing protein 6 [Mizuhopecten yessoensis]
MSQVGIPRPSFSGPGQKVGVSLPQIEHPLSRMENPEHLGVRGVSRAGDRPGSHPNFGMSSRPLANENTYPTRKSMSALERESRRGSRMAMSYPNYNATAIPEGVEVTYGDPNKTRLPVFGSRADVVMSRMGAESRVSSRLSNASTRARLEVDEIEARLRQKMRGSFYEVKKRFKDMDPEQKGNVSREALHRILVTVLTQEMGQSVFNRLMDRFGFSDRQMVNYTELFAHFREMPDDYPQWMDPVQRNYASDKASMSSGEVHAQLREKAKQRFLDIADLIPQINPGGSGRILKSEFKQMCNKLMFYMEDSEFEKLWKKYDPKSTGTIGAERLLNSLGITFRSGTPNKPRAVLSPIAEPGGNSNRSPRRKEIERKQSLDVERWMKNKFREGCHNMKEAFEAKDEKNSGVVAFDDFLTVLGAYGLTLEKKLLAAFLSRCSVQARREGVPYREFLHRFQDRSETGMTHNILTNNKHRVNKRPDSPGGGSTMSSIEVQLMNMFQRDFLSLLGTFKSIDKLGLNVISLEEFRAAMESKFQFHLTDTQFDHFVDKLPLDEDGNVKYADFMQHFDTKGLAPSLFENHPKTDAPVATVANGGPAAAMPQLQEEMEVDPDLDLDEALDNFGVNRRTPPELFSKIKDLLNRRFQEVEKAFYSQDEINSRRLTQESFYRLMKKFDIQPEISRGEIRDLWRTFITNTDKTLDYHQFVRHFGFSMRSAAFPNAKVNPPRKGDADFMLRSRKLNCAADMLQDNLRAKVDYMWEDLRKEFVAMDLYGTGFVQRDEFRELLTELCVHLSDYEVNMLCNKFEIRKDGRVNYIEFLKPFALRKQVWRHGNNMLSLLQHPQPELPITDIVEPPQKGLHGLTAKLRQKLAGDWKNLRRAFRKLDTKNIGYLSLPEFRSVLKLANVILDEDEVYHVMTQFDNNMSGKIPYEKFIEETFKPQTNHSVKRL